MSIQTLPHLRRAVKRTGLLPAAAAAFLYDVLSLCPSVLRVEIRDMGEEAEVIWFCNEVRR